MSLMLSGLNRNNGFEETGHIINAISISQVPLII